MTMAEAMARLESLAEALAEGESVSGWRMGTSIGE